LSSSGIAPSNFKMGAKMRWREEVLAQPSPAADFWRELLQPSIRGRFSSGWGRLSTRPARALFAAKPQTKRKFSRRVQALQLSFDRYQYESHETITIRELHQATGRWVRRASAGEVYVTERGRLVAKIVPASPLPAKPFFADPKFTRAFLANRKHLRGGSDSTQVISEERNREVL
jgi:antitoxin (DNA-binding transcriptional repressor) of toxin-antitoxin stability system